MPRPPLSEVLVALDRVQHGVEKRLVAESDVRVWYKAVRKGERLFNRCVSAQQRGVFDDGKVALQFDGVLLEAVLDGGAVPNSYGYPAFATHLYYKFGESVSPVVAGQVAVSRYRARTQPHGGGGQGSVRVRFRPETPAAVRRCFGSPGSTRTSHVLWQW